MGSSATYLSRLRVFLAETAVFVLAIVTIPMVAQGQPRVIDTLGSDYSWADFVSETGVVAGRRRPPEGGNDRAFVWTEETGMVDISLGSTAVITDLSPTGILVGSAFHATGQRAFVWTQQGGLRDLGTLGGPSSTAEAVSENGVVVGMSEVTCPPEMWCGGYHIFAWRADQGFVDLTELTGALTSPKGGSRVALSATGMVVGTYQLPSGDNHAFAWTFEDGLTDLGTLGGSWSAAVNVNRNGAVIGESALEGDVETRAFLWTRAEGMRNLGTLGGPRSIPNAISDTGIVVGRSMLPGDDPAFFSGLVGHAFKWTADEGMIDLGTLGGSGSDAEAVSNDGVVGGRSLIADNMRISHFAWSELGMVELASGKASAKCAGTIINRCKTIFANNGAVSFLGGSAAWSRSTGEVTLTLGGTFASTDAMSRTGIVVGSATTAEGVWRPMIWTAGAGTKDLGTPAGNFDGGGAYAVSSNGLVVGESWQDEFPYTSLAVVWNTRATGTALTADKESSIYGESVTLSAEVTSIGGVPTGDVEFLDADVVIGEAALTDGAATLTIATLAAGSHTITARYVGDTFQHSTSSGVVLVVVAANVSGTPTGSNVVNEPIATLPDGTTSPVSITFGSVTGPGQTTVTTSTNGPPPPDGFKIVGGLQPIYYDVSTTATFSTATLCFSWQEGQIRNESNARLFHFENGKWVDITTTRDTTRNLVCGETTSLSPFAIGEERVLGFYQPIDNSPVFNAMKAGSAVPVKFRLSGNEGLDIFAAGFPVSVQVSCSGSTILDTVEQTVSSGSSSLSFDAATGQYNYVWKTNKEWAGTCRQLILKLKDGAVKSALFTLTR